MTLRLLLLTLLCDSNTDHRDATGSMPGTSLLLLNPRQNIRHTHMSRWHTQAVDQGTGNSVVKALGESEIGKCSADA
jgi:hypothetical protein